MTQQSASATEKKGAYWLSHPNPIDRTKVYKNLAGEVVPFGVMKLCTKCNKEKDLWDGFYYRASSSDLHQTWCKECAKDSSRDSQRKKRNPNIGKQLLHVPAATTIHAGVGVRTPEPAVVPVTTPPTVVPPPEKTPEIHVPSVAPAALAEPVAPAVAPVEPAPQNGIVSVAHIEAVPAEKPSVKFDAASFIEFHDWLTGPDSGKSLFMTRGSEAIVRARDDGMCWISTPNQSGPRQWLAPEITAYILKLLTGENTDEAFYGLLYH